MRYLRELGITMFQLSGFYFRLKEPGTRIPDCSGHHTTLPPLKLHGAPCKALMNEHVSIRM